MLTNVCQLCTLTGKEKRPYTTRVLITNEKMQKLPNPIPPPPAPPPTLLRLLAPGPGQTKTLDPDNLIPWAIIAGILAILLWLFTK